MADNQGTLEASAEEIQEVDVILIDGTAKRNYKVILTNSVLEEKERIWNTETRVGPPRWQDLVLVLIKRNGETQVMDDDKNLSFYIDDFSSSQIQFLCRSLARDSEGRVANLEDLFNTKMK